MGNGMNKIIPGLFVGNFRDSRDEQQLKDNKITHILSIHDNAKATRPDMIYLCISARDVGQQDLSQFFSECNDFIHSARTYGGNVLVHCLAGMSRSVTVTVAYIMTVTSLGWRDALGVVRASRQCASPNFGFQKQLLTFQHEGLKIERPRFQKAHSTKGTSHYDDEQTCQKILEDVACQEILKKHKEAHGDPGALHLSGHASYDQGAMGCAKSLMDEMFMLPRGTEQRASMVITLTNNREECAEGGGTATDTGGEGGETTGNMASTTIYAEELCDAHTDPYARK